MPRRGSSGDGDAALETGRVASRFRERSRERRRGRWLGSRLHRSSA